MFGRSRTRTVRRHGPRPASVLFAGLLTLALIAGFIYLAEESYNGLPFLSYRTVYASVPNIGHLQQHDPVDIAGVHVGQVLKTSTKDNRALVELQLQGVGPLPSDSKVVVRALGLLGERYVELEPGTSRTLLPNGATITETSGAATYYNGIPDTLNLFNAKTRTALGQMVRGLGEGVAGRGSQLNQAISVGAPSGANFDETAYSILSNPTAAASFLPDVDSGVTALDNSRYALTGTFNPAAKALRPLIAERAPTVTSVTNFPSTIDNVDYGFYNSGRDVALSVVNLSHALRPVLPSIPADLSAATRLLHDTPSSLTTVDREVLTKVPTAVPAALSIVSAAKPDLTPLKATLDSLGGNNGFVANLAEHGCAIQDFSTGVQSLVSFGTVPGGPFGPDVGFPVVEGISPQLLGDFAKTGGFPVENAYVAPCSYTPGPTFNFQTLTQLAQGVLPPQ